MKILKLALLASLTVLAPCAVYAAKTKPAAHDSKHDKHAPIEVTSDSLDVFQQENRAVFTGHVVAIQGDMRLKADTMTVHYRKQDDKDKSGKDKKKDKKSDSAAPGGVDAGAIKKIDADGNVFLSTPLETASGATGNYNVDEQKIYLNDHVVLTRGQNVLKGDHLIYNLTTGKSVLVGGDEAQSPAGKSKDRVHALFVPENKDKTKGDKK